ncbi:MAG: N-acetylmuramoyl-L-alanine amidase [Rhizobiaceae bacterium]|nr:N-acetylmuramoyl-L-alanine amidase [Rhizobiaceae bacterium]
MLAANIAAYENQTHNQLQAQGRIVPGVEGALNVFDVRPGHATHYDHATTSKKRIVLHYTAGYLGGDISTLTTPNLKVSVSFVVARNGRIYRLFPSQNWSFHTGPGTVGGNTTISSSSVGIEISNIGYLDQSGNWMWTSYGDRYCQVGEHQYYQTLATPFRDKRHYATFTEPQYVAVNQLLDRLAAKHAINRVFIPAANRFSVFPSSTVGQAYRGICSHVNYRPSGKWDIGPAFNWAAIGG